MRAKVFLLLTLLVISLLTGLPELAVFHSGADSLSSTTGSDLSPVNLGQGHGNELTVYASSGKVQTISVPSSGTYVSTLATASGATVFVNDLRGGDKVDSLLRNLTFLVDQDYVENSNVQVIVMFGNRIGPAAYQLEGLTFSAMEKFRNSVQHLSIAFRSTYSGLPFTAVELPYSQVFQLAQYENVAHVFLNKKYRACLNESVPLIKATADWHSIEQRFGFAINGSGVKIAVLDTGIDKDHPDLAGKVILEKSFTGEMPPDKFGHGTHCASIAAGTGKASNGTFVGVAPGASLFSGKVLTNGGYGFDDWIISGIEWAVNNSADVISMSLGANVNGDGTDPMSLALDWATDHGVVCVVAAGNDGSNGMNTVGEPAVCKKAITVGATDKNDSITFFSSQGLTKDYRLKPDVCAPGYYIIAARAASTSMGKSINSFYTMASGTSMACPHVAGAAALILHAHPDWTPLMVKAALMGNAKVLGQERLWRQGAGRVDVCRAVNTSLLLIEPSLSIGVFKSNATSYLHLTLMNVGISTISLNVSAVTKCDGVFLTGYIRASPRTLTVQPRRNATALLVVGPLLGNPPSGWWEGWLNLTSKQHTIRAPYLAGMYCAVDVRLYDEDNSTLLGSDIVVATYPERSLVRYSLFTEIPYSIFWPRYFVHRFFLKPGNYSFIASMALTLHYYLGNFGEDNTRSFIIEKIVKVPYFTDLNITLSLAGATKHRILHKDARGQDLPIHTYEQILSGGPYWNGTMGKTLMNWTLRSRWSGGPQSSLRRITAPLILYTSGLADLGKLSEAFSIFGTEDDVLSEVYIYAWKYWNDSIPDELEQPFADLAKYTLYYDIPEGCPAAVRTYCEYEFTLDYCSMNLMWSPRYGRYTRFNVPAGINATYYLTPDVATYHGKYYVTYPGMANPYSETTYQEWRIGGGWPPVPPRKGETGYINLGHIKFGPYVPGLTLQTVRNGDNSTISLRGDIWANLTWPYEEWYQIAPADQAGPISPYPQRFTKYTLYVDGAKTATGSLGRYDRNILDHGLFWNNISLSWNALGQRARLELVFPSLAKISESSKYEVNFGLGKNVTMQPFFDQLVMPHNYSIGETLEIKPRFRPDITEALLEYSFDNGNTWTLANWSGEGFQIPCPARSKLGIKMNATDLEGNRYFYSTSPAAMCRDVKIESLKISKNEIYAKMTDVEGAPLYNLTLWSISGDSASFAWALNNGTARVSRPSETDEVTLLFLGAGLYAKATVVLHRPSGDVNCDGAVNVLDMVFVASCLGLRKGDPGWLKRADANGDDRVNVLDLICCSNDLGRTWNPL